MPAQWQTWPCALPRTVPKACPPIRNDKALHLEGFFASCGPPDILGSSPRGELTYGSQHWPSLMEHRNKACQTSVRHQPSPPRHSPAGVSRPRFRPGILSPPLRAYHEAATAGSPTSPSGIACPVSPKDGPLPKSVPPCGVPAAIIKELPRRIRLFIAGRPRPILPEVFQRPGSKREREKTPASSLPSFPPPSPRPLDQTCPFLPAASQRRGPAARPEERFFGDGESTRGEGAVFTKNAPSPLVIPLLHGLSPTKKAGQWPAPAFTGKTKER